MAWLTARFAACLVLLLPSAVAICYNPQGEKMLTDYNPCYAASKISYCCATTKAIIDHNATHHDNCLPNGLCQSVEADGSWGYWREGCSDTSWPSAYCLNILTDPNDEDGNGVARLTPCEDSSASKTWCLGQNNTSCCGKGGSDEITIAATLAGFATATSSSSSSSSTTSSTSTTTTSSSSSTSTSASSSGSTSTTPTGTASTTIPGSASSTSSSTPTPTPSLSSGAKLGIGVGVGLGVLALLISLITLVLVIRKKRARSTPLMHQAGYEQGYGYNDAKYELPQEHQRHGAGVVEGLYGAGQAGYERTGGGGYERRGEMQGDWRPAEMDAGRAPAELEGVGSARDGRGEKSGHGRI
ncbi:hypothetical protein K461DRAFT_297863 [Myriangium duriaei CBS 260.36]|uniref:Mid2 domain-containing protein n=1 Tax=Myriangium duriaei CBS 260.36 TaxID=1168546 RepID=A0A9P4ITK4_9PEZI|nr:hypothetical protein K461DRAFT_297863 [Myriangium duriaei CBS 260.36]